MSSAQDVLVCGDRDWSNRERLYEYLDLHDENFGPLYVIQGGARGADAMAGEWVRQKGRSGTKVNAQWKKYGRAAGPIRNRKMLEYKPDIVIAFHDNISESKGTKDMLKAAKEALVPTILVTSTDVHPNPDPDNYRQLSLDL